LGLAKILGILLWLKVVYFSWKSMYLSMIYRNKKVSGFRLDIKFDGSSYLWY